jgi:hypothetical protein
MVKKDINKNLKKQVSKSNFEGLDVSGAGLETISKVVKKEALRKDKRSKSLKRGKKDCGCDN